MGRAKQLTTFGASGYTISSLQLFRGVDDQGVLELMADCPVLHLKPGEALANSGEVANLYVVLRGALRVSATAPDGLPEAVPAKVLPGESVGELSVLDDEAGTLDVVALHESEVLAIDPMRLWLLIDESNDIARNLLRLLAFRVRAANAQIRRRQKVGEFYRQLSMVDGLTDLYNRAWLNEQLPALIDNARTVGNPLSVIMIDLDHFKGFNDRYGHIAGDHALRVTAKVLTGTLRPRDFAARFGGEELVVILPGTSLKAGALVAQRLCERIRKAIVFADMHKSLPHVTASFGVAALCSGQDANTLLASADAALYRAKQAGRDRIELQD